MIVCSDCPQILLTKHTSPAEKLKDQKGERETADCQKKKDNIWRGGRAELKKGEVCALLCVRGVRDVERAPLEGGFVLQEFIKKWAVPIPDAHCIGANVLQHIYGPAQTPIHKVRIPGWVAFSGHVYLDERTFRPDGPASCIHRLYGPYLENWKAGVRGCFI